MAEFKVPTPEELQELRRKVGLTQTELGNRVGISQSLIARIERGKVNPSVTTLRRILKVIEEEQKIHFRLSDLLRWKRRNSKLPQLIWVAPEDKVRRAVLLMKRHDISQLPVLKGNSPVGSVYDRTIIREMMLLGTSAVYTKSVREIMEPIFPVFEMNESIEKAFSKIASGADAILVLDQGRPIGVITKIDVISFMKK